MPPKKSTTAAPKKAAAAPAHGSYIDMVKEAIINLKERNGSSRQAIKKYIRANHQKALANTTDAMFTSHVNRAIVAGEKNGDFARPKGASGSVKLAKKESKPAVPVTAKKLPAKPAAKATKVVKKTTTTKKAPAAKKVAAKKPAVKKATTTKKAPAAKKSAVAKPKANAGRPRKAVKAAPAVSDEPARILGKTKSGRVTKTKAPAVTKAAKKPVTKKAPAKKATPKKATPKKAAA